MDKPKAPLLWGAPDPSVFVKKCATKMLAALDGPIADVACGSGRNAFYLAGLGATVVALDRNLDQLRSLYGASRSRLKRRIRLQEIDFVTDPWPFGPLTLGGACLVHFLHQPLFRQLAMSIKPGGYLLIETMGSQGGNYVELPRERDLRRILGRSFALEIYEERHAGPAEVDAVAVRLLGRRR